MRHVPVEGVVLTDAELDHTLGHRAPARSAGTSSCTPRPPCRADPGAGLQHAARDPRVRRGGGRPRWRSAARHRSATATDVPSGLDRHGLPGPGRAAAVRRARTLPGHTVGLLVRDEATGGVLRLRPRLRRPGRTPARPPGRRRPGAVRRHLLDRRRADRARHRRADARGRWITCRSRGRTEAWSGWPRCRARHKVYTHINNTNPDAARGLAPSAPRSSAPGSWSAPTA